MRSNDETMRELERARLFMNFMTPVINGDGIKLPYSISNHGKTTGILYELICAFSLNEPMGVVPTYGDATLMKFDNAIAPGPNVTQPTGNLVCPLRGVQYCSGYISYKDIFGRSHTSRFCIKFGIDALSVAGSPEWNSEE